MFTGNWASMREADIVLCMAILAGLPGSVLSANNTITYTTVNSLKLTPMIKPPMGLKYGESSLIHFNYSIIPRNVTVYPKKGWVLSVSVDHDNVATVDGTQTFFIDLSKPKGNLSVIVTGQNAGRSKLRFHVEDWVVFPTGYTPTGADTTIGHQLYTDVSFQMYVTMKNRPIDTLFNIVVFLLVITANIGMGTQVDLQIVKDQLRLPIAPAIGLFSQFVFMPLIAFTCARTLAVEQGIALGLFASGCAPGGLASNIFTYLLGGSVSLSITMTLVSTLASLGLLPLWLFTLGQYLYKGSEIKIPFLNIFGSLFIIIVPTVIGLFMQWKTPRAAAILIKATKMIMALFMLFMFTVGAYANWWVLDLVDSKVLFASAALPYLGFALGGFAAFVGRRSSSDVITIAVETGIQNTAVPIVLLRMSLSGPEQATGIVVPLISSTLTPIPLVIAVIYLEIKACRRRKRQTKLKMSTQDDQMQYVPEEGKGTKSNTPGAVSVDSLQVSHRSPPIEEESPV